MIEKYTLDNLTQDIVFVKKQTYMEYEGELYPVGQTWSRGYYNSIQGREKVVVELPYIQSTAILAVWGAVPTVIEGAS